MAWEVDELLAKVERIRELYDAGLNTPQMFFVPHTDEIEEGINRAISWAYGIHKEKPTQIFNIRTYKRTGTKESVGTTHFTDIDFQHLRDILTNAANNFNCMVDAETPDNGRIAGNIIIHTNELGRPESYYMDYCVKEHRAMVRDADKHKAGSIRTVNDLGTPLADVVKGALKFYKKDVILEWTIFAGPAGVLNHPLVWWEYRKE